jgi:hypothetical protein
MESVRSILFGIINFEKLSIGLRPKIRIPEVLKMALK